MRDGSSRGLASSRPWRRRRRRMRMAAQMSATIRPIAPAQLDQFRSREFGPEHLTDCAKGNGDFCACAVRSWRTRTIVVVTVSSRL